VTASVLAAPGFSGWFGASLAFVMFAIASIDVRYFTIPDNLVLVALALGLLNAAIAQPEPSAALMAAILRGLALALGFWMLRRAYLWLRGREGMGLGDVKLAMVAGIWLDWIAIIVAIEIAALAALAVIGLRALRGRRVTARTPVPFGSFLAPAIWLAWLMEVTVLQAMF
jgi:leader peptidase (prepilin peptidase) / N-methyltransferase